MANAEATPSDGLDAAQLRELLRQANSQLADLSKQLQGEETRRQVAPRSKRQGMPPPTYQTPKRPRLAPMTPFKLGNMAKTAVNEPAPEVEAKAQPEVATKVPEPDDDANDDWSSWTRANLLQIILSALSEGQTIAGALKAAQINAWSRGADVNEDEMGTFYQMTQSALQFASVQIDQCTQLVEVQRFLDSATEARRTTNSINIVMAISQLRMLQQAIVKQLMEDGASSITDDWTEGGCISLRNLREVCQDIERDYRARMKALPSFVQAQPLRRRQNGRQTNSPKFQIDVYRPWSSGAWNISLSSRRIHQSKPSCCGS